VIGGVLAAAIGIQAVYFLGGGLLLLAAAIGWHGLRGQSPKARKPAVIDAAVGPRPPATI